MENPKITKEEFLRKYAERSGKTPEEMLRMRTERGYVIAPCDCGEEICEGWGWVSRDTGGFGS